MSEYTDLYAVHVFLSRPEDVDPPEGASLTVIVETVRTPNTESDALRAGICAEATLRPYLNNSTHLKSLAVLL